LFCWGGEGDSGRKEGREVRRGGGSGGERGGGGGGEEKGVRGGGSSGINSRVMVVVLMVGRQVLCGVD